jgi:multidrug efflux system outer membrane protein
MRRALRLAGIISIAAVIGGCTMAPRYERPAAPVAATFPAGGAGDGASAADLGWRTFFPQPRLQALIATALAHNRDLRSATLNVALARAQYRIREVALLPAIDGTAEAERERIAADLSPTGAAVTGNRFSLEIGVTAYELDLFGRVRSLQDAGLATYLATREAQLAAHISLVAEVARAYLAERTASERLDLARGAREARISALGIERQRFTAGVASALDVTLAQTLVESAHVSVAALIREHAQALDVLTLLTGHAIVDLPPAEPLLTRAPVTDIPAGLPATLLERRPDIRAAEQRLLAANADIGAARAAFFPRITLTGAIGTASPQLSGLFDGDNRTWSFMPQLVVPIFSMVTNRANLQIAEVRKEQAVVGYEQAIQTAFREVADALVARAPLEDQVQAQTRLRATQAERLGLAEQRHASGVEGYLAVLDAKRDLFEAEQALVQAQQLRLLNAIGLYKALGGGVVE